MKFRWRKVHRVFEWQKNQVPGKKTAITLLPDCQGVRSKRKKLELYLNENSIDIIALNETFLNKKVNFKIQGYDTIRNDRSTGQKGGVAFLVKHGLVVNKEFRNADFNIITDNEALAINLELSCNQNLTLATIYCPNGKPNLSLFQTIYNLSDNVMFVGDFNSKSEAFGCASKNDSGPILKTIQNTLDLIYLNNTEHTYMEKWQHRHTRHGVHNSKSNNTWRSVSDRGRSGQRPPTHRNHNWYNTT